ncbi:MAG TPA: MFS transporter [Polyangiaceae bacterium]|jgi:DHA1 family tetracycline resistance protein-like MFS transporter
MPRSEGAPETPDPRASRVVTFVFLTVFLDLIGFGIVIPLFPFYVKSMGGSARTVGFLLSCFSFTQLVATPFLGRLSDRVGRRKVILFSLAGNAVSMVLFALATKLSLLPLLFASRILAGATAGNLAACQAAIADVTTGERRAWGMGRLGAGIGLGLVLGPALGGALSHFGMWAPPLGAAGMAVADLAAAFFLMPETHAPENVPSTTSITGPARAAVGPVGPPARRHSLVAVLAERRLVIVLVLYFCTFLYMTTMQVALALLAKERLGWGESQVGNVFALFGVIMLVTQGGLIGWIARTFGQVRVVAGGALVSATGLTTIAFAYHFAPLLAGLLLLAFGLGVTQPLLSSIAAECAGSEQRGAVLGFAQSAGGVARTVGPTLSGFLFEGIGSGAPFVGGAVAAVFAFVLAIALGSFGPARVDIPS